MNLEDKMIDLSFPAIQNAMEWKESLDKVYDLSYYDGPLVSHFVDSKKENVIFHWIDVDHNSNRWLTYSVYDQDLLLFLKGELSYLNLIKRCFDIWRIIDIGDNLTINNAFRIVRFEQIPKEYLPEKEAYFDLEELIVTPEMYMDVFRKITTGKRTNLFNTEGYDIDFVRQICRNLGYNDESLS
jgi:hypothetical protein